MSRERCGLAAHALYQIPITAKCVNVVIENLKARLVIAGLQPIARHRHADAVPDPLAQRTGSRLDSRSDAVLGVPGCAAIQLAKTLEVVDGNGRTIQDLVLGIDRLPLG